MAAISSYLHDRRKKAIFDNYDLFQNSGRALTLQRQQCKVALKKHHEKGQI